ncbi:hypothetical protein [Novosphingobium sp. TH158]|uniref:hypothetical protein n=1 Tax=Novosphingobium sp. TH158 TaxID=2067455 RepID=UPI0011817A1A|nr:hypothetical protein [Novosphingobium sp. TH158]
MMVAPTARIPSPPPPPALFQVELWGGGEKLWSGQMRLANYAGASFNSTLSEAPEPCPADKSALGTYAPNQSRSLRVAINRRGYAPENPEYTVSASWTRPAGGCEAGGTSSVSFDRPMTIAVGQKQELKGDGGLAVVVTRLK